MAIPWTRQQASVSTSNQTVTTTAETAVATLPGISLNHSTESVYLRGLVYVLVGAAGVSVEAQIRRGNGVTGTVVSPSIAITATAAGTVAIPVECIDLPGDAAGEQYTLTVTVASATGNSTVKLASLYAAY